MFTMSTQHRRCRSITSLMRGRQSNQAGVINGGMTVLSIMVTAYQVRWGAVDERIVSHPWEAEQLDEHGHTVLYKALSRRIDDYPPFKTIQALLEANREAVWEAIVKLRDFNSDESPKGNCRRPAPYPNTNPPLTVACWRRASLEILKPLVAARPSIPEDVAALIALWNSYRELFGGEQELITVLCEGGREAFLIFVKLHCLLTYCTASGLKPWQTGCSVHRAASAPVCSLPLFQVILQKFPGQIRQRDENGRLPLHNLLLSTLCIESCQADEATQRQSRFDKMKILLEIYPQASQMRDISGRLPIHLAITSGMEYQHLKDLIDSFPQCLSERDGQSSLFPFQLAAASGSSLSLIYQLLHATPSLIAMPANPQEAFMSTSERITVRHQYTSVTSTKKGHYVTDELKALLAYVAAKQDDNLWKELQILLRNHHESPPMDNWLALHAAASLAECPVGLLRVIIHMHPEQLQQLDPDTGRTPLHIAAANHAKSLLATSPYSDIDDNDDDQHVNVRILRLKLLLQSNPGAAQVYDNSGQLPLHLACYHGLPSEALDALILAWPDALCRRDGELALHPFLLAACSPSAGLTEMFTVLLRAPHVLRLCGVVKY